MPAPSYVNTTGTLPVKIEMPLRTSTRGLEVTRSAMTAYAVADRYSGEVSMDVQVTATIRYDTTGQASALPDGKYSTLFMLGLDGIVSDGLYIFPDSVQSSDGIVSGDRSDQLMWKIVTSGSNATGEFYIDIRFVTANVDFGHGVLFPNL